MKPWKELEKEVARRIGGIRVVRTNWKDALPDIKHGYYTVECKYWARFPAWYIKDLGRIRKGDVFQAKVNARKKATFLAVQGLQQALSYDANKIPVCVIKGKHTSYDDAVVFFHHKDFPVGRIKVGILIAKTKIMYTGLKEFGEYWNEHGKELSKKGTVDYG